MATYAEVVAQYVGYPDKDIPPRVTYTHTVIERGATDGIDFAETLGELTDIAQNGSSPAATSQDLLDAIQRSAMGERRFRQLTGSQLDPHQEARRSPQTVRTHAEYLRTSRLLSTVILQQDMPVLPHALRIRLPTDRPFNTLATQLHQLDTTLRPGLEEPITPKNAHHLIDFARLSEDVIARIALSELAPAYVLDLLDTEGSGRGRMRREFGLLLAARSISRSMHLLSRTRV